jgi:hypothetical protein
MDEAELRRTLAAEGIERTTVDDASGYAWANGPGDSYGAHRHEYDKVLVCLAGSITFGLPERGEAIELLEGQRLDLAVGTLHRALVGPNGVRCYELHLPAGTLAGRADVGR